MKKSTVANYKGRLTAELVDEYSERIGELLKEMKFSGKDIIRFRLSVESAMVYWMENLEEGVECEFSAKTLLGRLSISVSCEGKKCDPRADSSAEYGALADYSLLQTLGLTVGYTYENGVNRINIMPQKGVVGQLLPVFLSMALGVICSVLLLKLFPNQAAVLAEQYVSPVFSALMNVLRTIAGPLIFLAVLSGVYGIGDLSSLGIIGKKLMGRFIFMTFITLLIALAVLLFIVPVQLGSYTSGSSAVSSILNLVLQFIPTDIVTPFANGNMLQIIFLAFAVGIGMLILGKNVVALNTVVGQIYAVVQLLMETIGKMIPVFVFISIFDFVLSGSATNLQSILFPFMVISISFILVALLSAVRIRIRLKLSLSELFKKLLPTFIIAFTTASSAAAFSVNIDTCEKDLGISQKITRFGIPLGQVVFMPIAAVEYIAISMILADSYGVTITPMWIITAILVCGVLAIATPPIPGGAMSIFTVLFLQLNVPASALAIAISIDLLVDYIVTAGDLACLQEEMVLIADKTDLLNKKQLLKKKS